MKKIICLMSLLLLSSINIFAADGGENNLSSGIVTTLGNPFKKNLPNICKANEKVFKFITTRMRSYQYEAKSANGGIQMCSGGVCQPYYGGGSNGCYNPKLITYPSLDTKIDEFCSREDIVCEEAKSWKGSMTPIYPTCEVPMETLDIKVYVKLTGEKLKQARCEKLDECLPLLDSRSEIKAAQKWQENFNCP